MFAHRFGASSGALLVFPYMMDFSLLVPLKSSLSRLVLFSHCGGHKEEEHDFKVSFVADAGEGGDWDSCDGVRRCVRH